MTRRASFSDSTRARFEEGLAATHWNALAREDARLDYEQAEAEHCRRHRCHMDECECDRPFAEVDDEREAA